MKKIAEIVLRSFLRRYPVPTRSSLLSSLFSQFGQYAWLTDILEELRRELVPDEAAASLDAGDPAVTPPLDERILSLEHSEVQGRLSHYTVHTYQRPRGTGHLFKATNTTTKQPVVIKEFLLPAAQFTRAEAYQHQQRFQRLAGIQLADGRLQECRVIQPLEAIADTHSHERCFLVTDAVDSQPTLRQHLAEVGPLPEGMVQDVLSQVLQTLDFLHQQKYSFPGGGVQDGLVHGNLSLDSVLWTEQHSQPFVYLCDLALWEHGFDPVRPAWQSTQVTPDALQRDLQAVGDIGMALLPPAIAVEPRFQNFLRSLQTRVYNSAETARRELLRLAEPAPAVIAPLEEIAPQSSSQRQSSLILGLLLLGGLIAGAVLLVPRLRSPARSTPPLVSTCCLAEISAIPAGTYTYTSVTGGTWWSLLQQRNLLQRDRGFTDVLAAAQPKLQLRYAPAASLAKTLEQVRSGAAAFAVVPLLDNLPSDLLVQEIAYDGLAAVVAFSYAERQQGLPTALKGRLQLDQVQRLYGGQIDQWRTLNGPDLAVRRYVSSNPDALAVMAQRLLPAGPLETLPAVRQLPALALLRQVIRDFEANGIASVGVTTLSELAGQCAVYPLALSQAGQAAVQPIVLSNGEAINPETDLCDRKGAYGPDPVPLQTGTYPLSYPLVVVYPRDNRRSAMGKKFVELMRTIEGQQLLRAAGLVPISPNLSRPLSPSPVAPR